MWAIIIITIIRIITVYSIRNVWIMVYQVVTYVIIQLFYNDNNKKLDTN